MLRYILIGYFLEKDMQKVVKLNFWSQKMRNVQTNAQEDAEVPGRPAQICQGIYFMHKYKIIFIFIIYTYLNEMLNEKNVREVPRRPARTCQRS